MTAHKLLNPQLHILTNRVSHVSHFRHQQARWQHLMKCSTTVDVPGEKLFFIPKMWKKKCCLTFLGNVKCDNMSAGFLENVTNLPLFVCAHATLPRRTGTRLLTLTRVSARVFAVVKRGDERGRRRKRNKRRWEDRVISPPGTVAGNQACDRVVWWAHTRAFKVAFSF